MAPRSRAATLAERPSSSSGPGSARVSARPRDYDKRKSRDDLYISTMTAEKRDFKSFHVPIRGRLPSPEDGPSRQVGDLRTSRTDSIGTQGDTGVIAIGMALGSPSHGPAGTGWQPQLASIVSPSTASDVRQPQQEDSSPKPKSRKWGIFRSRSKSKRSRANTETNPPQSKMESSSVPSMSPATPAASAGERHPGSTVGRSGSVAASPAKHKPIVVRSNTAPVMGDSTAIRNHPQPSRAPPQPPHKPVQVQTTATRHHERPTPASGFHLPTSRGPLLDVEIPDITMERYSVMFGQVLQKKPQQHQQPQPPQRQQQPQPQPIGQGPSSSSLLARRQATLGKLRTIDEPAQGTDQLEPPPPPRRASSPQPRNSPTFHLFPPTPKRSSVTQTQSPRLRSNTSPAGIPSPSHATFDQSQTGKEAPRAQTLARSAQGDGSRERLPYTFPQAQRLPQPMSRLQHPVPQDQARNPVFDSPTSIDGPPEVEMKATPQPSIKDLTWEMMSPPASTASSNAGTPKKGSLSSVLSSEQITVPKPPGEEAGEGKTLKDAVEASITRQISVSRDQRQLLGSLRGQNRRKKDGFTLFAAGSNERLVETKKLTPTVVHPSPQDDSSPSLHMHRRSERVIVEGA